jgi:hypothetical protein
MTVRQDVVTEVVEAACEEASEDLEDRTARLEAHAAEGAVACGVADTGTSSAQKAEDTVPSSESWVVGSRAGTQGAASCEEA